MSTASPEPVVVGGYGDLLDAWQGRPLSVLVPDVALTGHPSRDVSLTVLDLQIEDGETWVLTQGNPTGLAACYLFEALGLLGLRYGYAGAVVEDERGCWSLIDPQDEEDSRPFGYEITPHKAREILAALDVPIDGPSFDTSTVVYELAERRCYAHLDKSLPWTENEALLDACGLGENSLWSVVNLLDGQGAQLLVMDYLGPESTPSWISQQVVTGAGFGAN